MIYAIFDANGKALGFLPSSVFGNKIIDGKPNPRIPPEAVEITDGQWQELLADTRKVFLNGAVTTRSNTPSSEALLNYAKNRRYEVEIGGITLFGVPFSSDDRSKTLILGAQLLCQQDPNHSEDWWAADGTSHHVDATMIDSIAKAIAGHVSRCFKIFGTISAGISAGTIKSYSDIDQAFAAISA